MDGSKIGRCTVCLISQRTQPFFLAQLLKGQLLNAFLFLLDLEFQNTQVLFLTALLATAEVCVACFLHMRKELILHERIGLL